MIRKALVGIVAMACLAVCLAVAGSPSGASTSLGQVAITCNRVTFSGLLVLNRDNTGNKREALNILVLDGTGAVLLDRDVSGSLGDYANGLGAFAFTTAAARNPVSVQLVSKEGNDLPAQTDVYVQGRCDKAPIPFLHALYVDFLGRPPTDSEITSQLYRLTHGTTRGTLAVQMAASTEYLGRLVNELYRNTLGRDGDFGGVAYWVGQIDQHRKTLSQVTASFYASDEYFRIKGGNTNESWVRDLYVQLLRRTPDDFGLRYWSNEARRTRTPVALNFFQSQESKRSRIQALYQHFLGRGPSALSVSYWLGRLATSSDLELASDLASTPEYSISANSRFP